MDTISAAFASVFADAGKLMMGVMVFLAAGTFAFALMAYMRVRGAVKKRTSRILDEGARGEGGRRSLRYSSIQAVSRLLEYTTKHYSEENSENMKVLRSRLIQAGVFDPRGVAYFFICRTMLAVGLAVAVFLLLPLFLTVSNSMFWLTIIVAGIGGYVAPSMYIDRRIAARSVEHRAGFPDF